MSGILLHGGFDRGQSRILGFQTRGVERKLLVALGARVRALRAERGFSQEGFADHCGVHRTFMGAVERGESNLSFHNLVRIATGLELTLSQLLNGVEQRSVSAETTKLERKRSSGRS